MIAPAKGCVPVGYAVRCYSICCGCKEDRVGLCIVDIAGYCQISTDIDIIVEIAISCEERILDICIVVNIEIAVYLYVIVQLDEVADRLNAVRNKLTVNLELAHDDHSVSKIAGLGEEGVCAKAILKGNVTIEVYSAVEGCNAVDMDVVLNVD